MERTSSSPHLRLISDAAFLRLLVSALLALGCFLLASGGSFTLQDFRCFYTAGQMLRHCPLLLFDVHTQQQWQHALVGDTLVLPFYHPAYEALLYLPLTPFSFRSAYFLYAACNLLLLWLCYLAAPRPNSTSPATSRTALFFLSFPVLLIILIGQNALWVLLAVCLAYNALTHGRDGRAGILLGLVTFKLAVIIPLAVLIGIRRGRRFLAAFALTFAAVMGLSVWITGLSATREFLHLLTGAALAGNQGVQQQIDSAVWLRTMPNLAGLFYLFGSEHLGAHVAFAFNLAASLSLLGLCAWIQRRATRDATAFSAAILCTVLVSPHLNLYDLAIVVLPFLLLSHRWLKHIALLWFLLPPVLYAVGRLTWFAPVVVVPLLLLAICLAQFRREAHDGAAAPSATPAYS